MQDQSNREITWDIQSVKLHLRSFLCPFSYQDINGEVQDLSKLADEAEYVKSGCSAACENKLFILARIMQNVLITTMCTSVIAARLHIMATFATKLSFVVEE